MPGGFLLHPDISFSISLTPELSGHFLGKVWYDNIANTASSTNSDAAFTVQPAEPLCNHSCVKPFPPTKKTGNIDLHEWLRFMVHVGEQCPKTTPGCLGYLAEKNKKTHRLHPLDQGASGRSSNPGSCGSWRFISSTGFWRNIFVILTNQQGSLSTIEARVCCPAAVSGQKLQSWSWTASWPWKKWIGWKMTYFPFWDAKLVTFQGVSC